MNQQQSNRGKALLTVDDELLAVLVTDDDGTKKVMAIVLDGGALILRLVTIEELFREVVDQFGNLFALPAVLTLVIVDGELGATQESADILGKAPDLLHRASPPMISPSNPSVSFSSARMSARISSSVRSGCGL